MTSINFAGEDIYDIEMVNAPENLNIMCNGEPLTKISINESLPKYYKYINNFINTESLLLDKHIIIPNHVVYCALDFKGDLTIDLRNINENIDMSEAQISTVAKTGNISYPTLLINDTFLKLKKLPKFSEYMNDIHIIYDNTVERFINCITENEEFIKKINTGYLYLNEGLTIKCTDGSIYL